MPIKKTARKRRRRWEVNGNISWRFLVITIHILKTHKQYKMKYLCVINNMTCELKASKTFYFLISSPPSKRWKMGKSQRWKKKCWNFSEKISWCDLKLKSAKVSPTANKGEFSWAHSILIPIKYVIELEFGLGGMRRSSSQLSGRFYHCANKTNTKEIRN